ncbi:MAG: hypothetical protein IPL61_09435 [Myxococcales bacterium]|nr:hypothetical protein [Myxococcales bacterium]
MVRVMTPTIARIALRQTTVTEVLGLLAYAEGFALVVGSLGLGLEPPRVVRHAAHQVIAGKQPWAPHRAVFPAHLRAVARAVMADRLRLEALARTHPGCALPDVRMTVAQVGDLAGVAELAHSAGEVMVFHRADAPALLAAAVPICDSIRALLERLAHQDAGADTAPIAMAREPGTVQRPISTDGPSQSARPEAIRTERTPKERR